MGSPFAGRSIRMAFLGQSGNRLDHLSIAAIQNRILISPLVAIYQAKRAEVAATRYARGGPQRDPVLTAIFASGNDLPALGDQDRQALAAIAENPTAEELEDLSIIDGFFQAAPSYVNAPPNPSLTVAVCQGLQDPRSMGVYALGAIGPRVVMTPASAFVRWLLYQPPNVFRGRPGPPNVTPEELATIKDNPFFCGPIRPFSTPSRIRLDYPSWFGIDQNATWGAIKLEVKNAITVMEQIDSFPFPPPIGEYVYQYWATVQGNLQKIVHIGSKVEPEGLRFWITLSVLENYEGMVSRIEHELKRKAKKAKKKAILTAIGLSVASLVLIWALPVVAAAAVTIIKAGIDTYMTLEKRRKAAKDMAEAAKLFEKDAPAFAEEVDKLAKMMDEQAAAEERAKALPPDLVQELNEPDPWSPQPTVEPLAIGGGVAVIALAAFALFKV